jgi:hypothetical protein
MVKKTSQKVSDKERLKHLEELMKRFISSSKKQVLIYKKNKKYIQCFEEEINIENYEQFLILIKQSKKENILDM